MGRLVGGRARKFSDICLHNNAIVMRSILVTNVALWDTRTASAPSILLVLLEPHCKGDGEKINKPKFEVINFELIC